jgi:hypothetical protein
MERSTIFNGKTHYFNWAMFNSYVKLPEGNPLGGKSINTLGTSGRIWQTSYLVGGFNHLEKYESQWEGLSHILWKIKAMFETTIYVSSETNCSPTCLDCFPTETCIQHGLTVVNNPLFLGMIFHPPV